MKRLIFFFFALTVLFGVASLTSCRRTVNFSEGNLSFSKDTVIFDTVFTTIGSTTQQFKFYNKDNRTVNVEEIELMGGDNSPFRVNMDGLSGTFFENIELEGKDSLFVFVEVTLDVNNSNNPMVIEDSIRFRTNGKDQYVILAVWGQDMYFHQNEYVVGTWPNDKPHVIYGNAVINENTSLTIPAGTQVYLHKNSRLTNFKGTLNIEGTLGNEVVFQGDRLESLYDDVAGQFYGIYMFYAKESKINYLNIKNGTVGLHIFNEDPANVDYTVRVTNSIITNNAYAGILLYSGAHLRAENCVISKNSVYGLASFAGNFSLNHCHVVGYSSAGSQTPAVGISNLGYDEVNDVGYYTHIAQGEITNSVIYGNLDTELVIDTTDNTNVLDFNLTFEYNLIKSEETYNNQFFANNIWNEDPYFVDPSENNFLFWSISPLHLYGNFNSLNTIGEPADGIGLNGVSRLAPDIGAYEIH